MAVKNGGSYSTKGGIGGLGAAMGQGGGDVDALNTDAYGNVIQGAGQRSGDEYAQGGAAQGRQLNNPYGNESRAALQRLYGQEGQLAGNIQDQLSGKAPSQAQSQFQSELDQSVAAQQAGTNSSHGGALALAGAQRGAAQMGADQRAQATAQAAALRARETAQQTNALSGLYGQVGAQRQGQYGQEDQTALAEQGLNDTQTRGMYGLAGQQQGLGLEAEQSMDQQDFQRQQYANDQEQKAKQGGWDTLGKAASTAMQVGSLVSDISKKTGIDTNQSMGTSLSGFLGSLRGPAGPTSPQVAPAGYGSSVTQQNALSGLGAASPMDPYADMAPGTADLMSDENLKMTTSGRARAGEGVETIGDHADDAQVHDVHPRFRGGRTSRTEQHPVDSSEEVYAKNPNLPHYISSGARAAGSFSSDERGKAEHPGNSLAQSFLDSLQPHSYHYKNPQDEPNDQPNGGKYLGVMAQDLERVPEIGRQMVHDTPRGKAIQGDATMSSLLGGVGELNRRLKALEGRK